MQVLGVVRKEEDEGSYLGPVKRGCKRGCKRSCKRGCRRRGGRGVLLT